jgi:orotate phosphoribosyltransferase
MKKMELWRLNPRDYESKNVASEEILAWFRSEDAYWIYEGEPSPERPHAELTSGLCSDGFFDCLQVLRYPNIAEILARQLVQRLFPEEHMIPLYGDGWVVSSSYAAITFGHEVAKALKAIFMMAEKDENNPKRMVWRRMTIPDTARVLQVEELVTTSQTFQEVRRAVEEGNAVKPVNFISTVGALVHRPPKLPVDYDGRRVVALIEKEIRIYKPEECPYCAVGSPRYRPKTHWLELTGKK